MQGIDKAPVKNGVVLENGVAKTSERGITAVFSALDTDRIDVSYHTEILPNESEGYLSEVSAVKSINLKENENYNWYAVSGACDKDGGEKDVLSCLDEKVFNAEAQNIKDKWQMAVNRNFCRIPNKNLEYFINYWLKNNMFLTYRYDRAERFIGYRDSLQDSWGYCLVNPDKAREKMLITLGHMMSDGRCPRRFSRFGLQNDMSDFCDAPTWAPEALDTYIRETGDFDILNKKLPFLESDEEVLDTILRALPNHCDNSDMCRTSEPYAVGNVYYGPNHRRFGMNLFSWFTATPSWLMHGAFEQILGVYADYDGLRLTPHVIDEWKSYSVKKLYRGTVYNIEFIRTDGEKGEYGLTAKRLTAIP